MKLSPSESNYVFEKTVAQNESKVDQNAALLFKVEFAVELGYTSTSAACALVSLVYCRCISI